MKTNKQTEENITSWFRLDTSAKIYPAIESPEEPTTFRLSMTLQEDIDAETLQHALNIIKPRFPYFNVYLRTGIFWHYLEHNPNPPIVWGETPFPCERLYPVYNNGFLYNIRIYKKRIAAEFLHVLTDGSGGFEFLKTLVCQYLILKGKLNDFPEGIMRGDEKPLPEEYEDAFLNVMKLEKEHLKTIPKQRTLFTKDSVFKMRGPVLPLGHLQITRGTIPFSDLKSIAKTYDATVTELLSALYIEALIHVQHDQVKNKARHKPVGLTIPVNMRNFYPIRAMRNFSLFVVPRTDPKKVNSFEDIILSLKDYMKGHITRDNLLMMVKDNCTLGESTLIRSVPVFIKNLVIRYISNTQGHSQFSGVITNLGAARLPAEMEQHVDDVNIVLGPSIHSLTACAVIGYKDRIHINFGRINKEPLIEKHLFRRLVEMGAHVSIKTN